jgi:plastocyanin
MNRIRTPRSVVLGALVALTALLGAVGVGGAAETITSDPECCTYSKAEFQSNEGERPILAGNGIDFHNVTAKERGPDGSRLFRTRDIRGGTSPVEGAQYLTAGSYPFECTLHVGMEATLVVGSDGTPKARPQAIVAVLRQTLSRVRESGRVKVRLRSQTGARDIAITARGAGVLLARENGLDIGRGATRVVGLRLTRRGRAALASRRSVKVFLGAKVPFGSPASASRTLHGG